MLRPSCLTASSIRQSGSTACSISATPYSPKNPLMDDRLCLRSPPPQQTRWEPPELGAPDLGAPLQLEILDLECTYPSIQSGCISPNPEKGNGNPNSQIHTAKSKSRKIETNQDKPYLPILPTMSGALAFDKFSTDIAPRGAHTCQALQWIWARAVLASSHRDFSITRP